MGSKNRPIREQLEKIYGKGCMFQKARVAQRLAKIGIEPRYTTYKRKYTLDKQKTLERRMTLHHLKHKAQGGATNIQNGAVVNELAHRYIHSLKRNEEEVANDMMREWKRNKDNGFEECEVQIVPDEEVEQDHDLGVMLVEIDKDKIKVKQKIRRKHNKKKHRRKNNRPIKREYGGER